MTIFNDKNNTKNQSTISGLDTWNKAKELAEKGQEIKAKSLFAIDKDTDSFNAMMEAARLPKKTDEEKELREKAMQEATKQAILVPLETLQLSLEAVKLSFEIAQIGNKNAVSDAGVGAVTAYAAALSAYYNVCINMAGISDETFKEEIVNKAKQYLEETKKVSSGVEKLITKLIS